MRLALYTECGLTNAPFLIGLCMEIRPGSGMLEPLSGNSYAPALRTNNMMMMNTAIYHYKLTDLDSLIQIIRNALLSIFVILANFSSASPSYRCQMKTFYKSDTSNVSKY